MASFLVHAQTVPATRFAIQMGGSLTAGGAPAKEAIKGLMMDNAGNAYVIGNYSGTITFTGAGGGTYTSAGGQDVFVARFDTYGSCTWSTSFGSVNDDEGSAICFVKNNTTTINPSYFYITGSYGGPVTISGTALTMACGGTANAYIARYNVAGVGGTVSNGWANGLSGIICRGLAVEANSTNVFVAGYFDSRMYTPGTCTAIFNNDGTGTAGRDFFVARYTSAGVFQAALNPMFSTGDCEARGITLNGASLYITGTFKNNLGVVTAGVGTTASGYSDMFVAQYPTGFTTSVASSAMVYGGGATTTLGSTPQDGGTCISATNEGVFIGGSYVQNATFTSTAGSVSCTPAAGTATTYMFLMRLSLNINATAPKILYGNFAYSAAYGIWAMHQYSTISMPASDQHRTAIFLTGAASSLATMLNDPSTTVAIDVTPPSSGEIGFVGRFGYDDFAGVDNFYNSGSLFVNGISDYIGGIMNTGNQSVTGFAVGYGGPACDATVGGNFISTASFGNRLLTYSGSGDGFLMARSNRHVITSNLVSCGGATLQATYTVAGTPTYLWNTGATTSSIVTPTLAGVGMTTYTVTVNDAGCGTYNIPVVVDDPCPRLANPNLDADVFAGVTVSPNPGNGNFLLQTANSSEKTITVFDATGRLVLEKKNTTEETLVLDLTQQPGGLYFVKMTSGGALFTQRIIKQ